jgi:AraC-like DNA-binding protein
MNNIPIKVEWLWGSAKHQRKAPCYDSRHYLHTGIWQLLEGGLTCTPLGGKPRNILPGEVCITHADKPQITTQTDYAQGRRAIVRGADFNITAWGRIPLSQLLDWPSVVSGDQADALIQNVLTMSQLHENIHYSIDSSIRIQAAGGALLETLLEIGTLTEQGRLLEQVEERLMPTLKLMQENRHRLIRHAELAAATNLSESRFKTIFTETFGCAPMRFHLDMRLHEAARLLRETDRTVEEIALATGFSSAFHFSQRFKERFNTPPRTYRKMLL